MPSNPSMGVSLESGQSLKALTPASTNPRLILTFEKFVHVDQYPVKAAKGQYAIYTPLVNGKAPAAVVDVSLLPSLNPPFKWPVAVHAAFSIQLRIDAPSNVLKTRVYLLPLSQHRISIQAFDKNNKPLGNSTFGPITPHQVFALFFESPAQSIVIWNADDDFGDLAVTRIESLA